MNPTPEPGTARRSWSIRDVMIATAGVAVLMAGYRVEFRGARGLGLVPACALLVAGLWMRDAREAWRAAGVGPGTFQVYILAPVCGAAAVVLGNVVFIVLAVMVGLPETLKGFSISLDFGHLIWVPEAPVVLASLVLTVGPAIFAARLLLRNCWESFIEPTAWPPAGGGTVAAGEIKGETRPEPAPVGPNG